MFGGTAWTRTTIRRLTAFRNDLYTTDPNKKSRKQALFLCALEFMMRMSVRLAKNAVNPRPTGRGAVTT